MFSVQSVSGGGKSATSFYYTVLPTLMDYDCEHAMQWSKQPLIAASWQWLLTFCISLMQCHMSYISTKAATKSVKQNSDWSEWMNTKENTYLHW